MLHYYKERQRYHRSMRQDMLELLKQGETQLWDFAGKKWIDVRERAQYHKAQCDHWQSKIDMIEGETDCETQNV